MSYGYSKGPLVMGDISGSDDSNRNTGIDFEEDYIALKTNGNTRFRISGSSGEIRFNEAFTFPTSDGSANQVLKTDGSGQLSWTNQSGGGGGGGGGSTNSFQTISVSGQSDVVADSSTDTLTLVRGDNINITTNAGSDELTIAAYDVGKVLQVVHLAFTGAMASNSTSWTNVTDGDATMQANITPSADSSKVLIQLSVCTSPKYNSNTFFRLYDGSNAVSGGKAKANNASQEDGVLIINSSVSTPHGFAPLITNSFSIMDSPSTTSELTYTVQTKVQLSSHQVTINRNTRDGNYVQDSRGFSSITLYEIGA